MRLRWKFQRDDGKEMEIDVMAKSECGRIVLVDVKKTKERTGIALVKDFVEKCDAYSAIFPEQLLLPAFLSTGGFTEEATRFCRENCIGISDKITYFLSFE
ncbi:hypothetical protein MTBBW1_700001 [Desulfamplus magnetovallimortis]|uniref:Restriction endonuclease type IV Mrr domain-containing protein n=1 Tax=Desulfamplus magnetovallimortis TaxID=1246637 RepID=A0A1W1HIX7_9BACT|nr:hypothetical protein MTBBW1_700001 [Desulfamplus magnetovallimortis]